METWQESIDFIWEWARCELREGLFWNDLTHLFQEPRIETSESLNKANKGFWSLPTDSLESWFILSFQWNRKGGKQTQVWEGCFMVDDYQNTETESESMSENPHLGWGGLRARHCGHLSPPSPHTHSLSWVKAHFSSPYWFSLVLYFQLPILFLHCWIQFDSCWLLWDKTTFMRFHVYTSRGGPTQDIMEMNTTKLPDPRR